MLNFYSYFLRAKMAGFQKYSLPPDAGSGGHLEHKLDICCTTQ